MNFRNYPRVEEKNIFELVQVTNFREKFRKLSFLFVSEIRMMKDPRKKLHLSNFQIPTMKELRGRGNVTQGEYNPNGI